MDEFPPAPPDPSPGAPPPLTPGPVTPEPPKPSAWQRFTKRLGPIGTVLAALVAKFKGALLLALKFGWPALKTGGSMIVMIWVYTMFWGWPFAVGFVGLIFIHECGHLIVARQFGLKVGAPVFIPFMGAYIALKEAPQDAWMESCVGIGGPLLGSVGAVLCALVYRFTGLQIFLGLAYTGFFLNLFNLMPVGFLDGGRIATALSPWLWIVGLAILLVLLFTHFNLILVLVLITAIPRVWMLFRDKTEAEQRYFEVTTEQRVTMSILYFGLIALLVLGMHWARIDPRALD